MRGRSTFGSSASAVWRPGPEHLARSRLAAAMRRWGFSTLRDLHAASIEKPDWFWREAAADLGVECRGHTGTVCDTAQGHEFPRWFVGSPGTELEFAL